LIKMEMSSLTSRKHMKQHANTKNNISPTTTDSLEKPTSMKTQKKVNLSGTAS
jgi:hypothetical protein